MTEFAVRARNLSKQYKLGEGHAYKTLRESLTSVATTPLRLNRRRHGPADAPLSKGRRDTIWALEDVSFEVNAGDTVAVIGRNGSGKSTLLKVLSRITEPTRGSAEIYGRVASLLEVGTGFHPELTGRENIFLNGAVLGMTRIEIQARFDQIVAFSEIERFLDTPVKYYSSGMYIRLAFSVAAHLEPDILVVDEVLAVGDIAFQKKCLGKMEDVAHGGRTILFVSHNMPAVLNLCKRAILLESGHLTADGQAGHVVDQYVNSLEGEARLPLSDRTDRRGTGDVRFVAYELCDASGEPAVQAICGADLVLSFSYVHSRRRALRSLQISVGVHGRLDDNLFLLSTEIQGTDLGTLPPQGTISCTIPQLPLLPGRYNFTLFATAGGEISDWIENAGVITVEAGDFFGSGRLPPIEQGPLVVQHYWTVDG